VDLKIERDAQAARGVRFSIRDGAREIAHAYLYVLRNDLHAAPFGLLEDLHVDKSEAGSGLGRALVEDVIVAAREAGCYKLIATSRQSRTRVQDLFHRLGFVEQGVEFRRDIEAARARPMPAPPTVFHLPPGRDST
jgi:GNAT superfamily N-acetyltransferase